MVQSEGRFTPPAAAATGTSRFRRCCRSGSFFFLLFFLQCGGGADRIIDVDTTSAGHQIVYAGLRSSYYGLDSNFSHAQWNTLSRNMASFFPGPPEATHIWIVGGVMDSGKCELEFTPRGNEPSSPFIEYRQKKIDHEAMLSNFDSAGVSVFLQVEPGLASIDTLIDIVLSRFKHHPCVKGFGIDAEWYRTAGGNTPNETVRVSNTDAQQWEQSIKSHKSSYRLFLKHFDEGIMPSSYRGDIIFVDDSQQHPTLDALVADFTAWARYFSPSCVMFQIGYDPDYLWWKTLTNPPENIGEQIALKVSNKRQKLGIIWVDFTLDQVKYPALKDLFVGM